MKCAVLLVLAMLLVKDPSAERVNDDSDDTYEDNAGTDTDEGGVGNKMKAMDVAASAAPWRGGPGLCCCTDSTSCEITTDLAKSRNPLTWGWALCKSPRKPYKKFLDEIPEDCSPELLPGMARRLKSSLRNAVKPFAAVMGYNQGWTMKALLKGTVITAKDTPFRRAVAALPSDGFIGQSEFVALAYKSNFEVFQSHDKDADGFILLTDFTSAAYSRGKAYYETLQKERDKLKRMFLESGGDDSLKMDYQGFVKFQTYVFTEAGETFSALALNQQYDWPAEVRTCQIVGYLMG